MTVYTTQASYLAAVSAPGVDTFNDLGLDEFDTPISRTAGAYSYTASVGPTSDFYGAGTSTDNWLSTNNRKDIVVFDSFSSGVKGLGGFFFGSNIAGSFAAGASMYLTATDSSGTVSYTMLNTTTSSFLGFVSNSALTSVSLTAGDQAGIWSTANDLTLATAVPEPETYAMLLTGLGLLGFMARRRKA